MGGREGRRGTHTVKLVWQLANVRCQSKGVALPQYYQEHASSWAATHTKRASFRVQICNVTLWFQRTFQRINCILFLFTYCSCPNKVRTVAHSMNSWDLRQVMSPTHFPGSRSTSWVDVTSLLLYRRLGPAYCWGWTAPTVCWLRTVKCDRV